MATKAGHIDFMFPSPIHRMSGSTTGNQNWSVPGLNPNTVEWITWVLTHASDLVPIRLKSAEFEVDLSGICTICYKLNNWYLFQRQIYKISLEKLAGCQVIGKNSETKFVICAWHTGDSIPIKIDYLRKGQLHISTKGHKVISLCQAQDTNTVSHCVICSVWTRPVRCKTPCVIFQASNTMS